MDNRQVFLATAATFEALVHRVPMDAWDRPGLGSWTVRALVGHTSRALTTVVEYLHRPSAAIDRATAAHYFAAFHRAGEDANAGIAERGMKAGDALGDYPAHYVSALVVKVREALDGVDDPVIHTAMGGMRLGEYLATRTFELTVHSSDIATAVGLPLELPREAIAQSVQIAAYAGVLNGQGLALVRRLTGRDGSTLTVL
ncbi:MAG: maleylpyruvate isomerase N-terminal domain-containing protein [Micropruina sp.]